MVAASAAVVELVVVVAFPGAVSGRKIESRSTESSRRRDRMRAWQASEPGRVLMFRRPSDAERWLSTL